jgi:hypothetical protein
VSHHNVMVRLDRTIGSNATNSPMTWLSHIITEPQHRSLIPRVATRQTMGRPISAPPDATKNARGCRSHRHLRILRRQVSRLISSWPDNA